MRRSNHLALNVRFQFWSGHISGRINSHIGDRISGHSRNGPSQSLAAIQELRDR